MAIEAVGTMTAEAMPTSSLCRREVATATATAIVIGTGIVMAAAMVEAVGTRGRTRVGTTSRALAAATDQQDCMDCRSGKMIPTNHPPQRVSILTAQTATPSSRSDLQGMTLHTTVSRTTSARVRYDRLSTSMIPDDHEEQFKGGDDHLESETRRLRFIDPARAMSYYCVLFSSTAFTFARGHCSSCSGTYGFARLYY